MGQVILVTGASSGFGRMIATDLAAAGHTVYASMRETAGKNAGNVKEIAALAKKDGIDLRAIELDVQDEKSIAEAIAAIIAAHGRIDVLVQNAGHMVYGPAEAFTPAQLAAQYDVNVLGAHRVNRAVLPHMRKARNGLLVWISSSSVAGGVPPLLGPYFAAKAGMDALAVCYAKEIGPFGNRDRYRRSRCLHQRNQSLRSCRSAGRQSRCGRLCRRHARWLRRSHCSPAVWFSVGAAAPSRVGPRRRPAPASL